MLLCVGKAAEFSPDWGRTKITRPGDGKRLAFLYDEVQGQLIVGVVVLNKAQPVQAVCALHVPDLAHCPGRACGAGYDLLGHLVGSFSLLILVFS